MFLGKLQGLTNLDVSHNQMKMLPPEIGKLVNMKSFDCSNNQITKLPAGLLNITMQDTINVYSALEIGRMKGLTYLNVGFNKLTELPSELSSLNFLIHLGILL